MAPLFQRRSVIRVDDTDYSVRATYSHASHDSGMNPAPPPVRIYSPPPSPVQPSTPPASSAPSRLKVGLEGLTDHARGLTRQLADAGRSRIATIAGRLARTLTDTDPPVVALASAPTIQDRVAMLAEERRWREYEAAQRVSSADSVSPAHDETVHDSESPARARDAASELLRLRAERVLTDAELVGLESPPEGEMEPRPEAEPSPGETVDCSASDCEMPPHGAGRGKYGTLMEQVGDRNPQNWETTPEESPMQEEHTNGTHTEPRVRSVKLDSDSTTIDITRESRFSGQLKFSGTLVIEGEVEGELEATRVIIREGGIASARILGDTITISGKVTGDVVARRALEMTSTGRLQGDVTAPEMKLHPGALVKGRCSIGEAA